MSGLNSDPMLNRGTSLYLFSLFQRTYFVKKIQANIKQMDYKIDFKEDKYMVVSFFGSKKIQARDGLGGEKLQRGK